MDSISTLDGLYGSIRRIHPSEQEDEVSCGVYTLFWGLQLFCGQAVDSLSDPRVSVHLNDFRHSLHYLLTLLQETVVNHVGSSRRRRSVDFHCRGSYNEVHVGEIESHGCVSLSVSRSSTPKGPHCKIFCCTRPRRLEIPSRSFADPSFQLALSKYVAQISPKRVFLTGQISLEAFRGATHLYLYLEDLGLVEWVRKRRGLCCFLLLKILTSVEKIQTQVQNCLQGLGPHFVLSPKNVRMCPSLFPQGLDSFQQLLLILHRRVMGGTLRTENDLGALKEELQRVLTTVDRYLQS